MSDLIRIINEEFERTVPIIYKEGEDNYVLIQKTDNGMIRIMARVTSEFIARKMVNAFIRKMKAQANDHRYDER